VTSSYSGTASIGPRTAMMAAPMISNNVCLNAHPAGCAALVRAQAAREAARGPLPGGPRRVLVLGASTGYGLASRLVSAFGSGARTLGVSYERIGNPLKPGTPGFYNNREFDRVSAEAGIPSLSIMGDAFADATREEVIAAARGGFGPFDLVVYSLASPVRTEPITGRAWQSSIKPIGEDYAGKLVDVRSGSVSDVIVPAATKDEIEGCVKVMGGEDWALWIDALARSGVLSEGALTVAYSYIGPGFSHPIYRSGTLGKAKEHLEATARELSGRHAGRGVKALVSVQKALVTRASMVIPSIPLYIMSLYRVMKAKGVHEGCLEQIDRLFRSFLYSGGAVHVDPEGRVRLDDRELDPAVQAETADIMSRVTEENMRDIADFEGFRQDFLEAHGFGVAGVDYAAPQSYE
jgi:enoyl-[acyl-carrier protein] reductase / trans-2-enoyl-CoA reductase (NAD+)